MTKKNKRPQAQKSRSLMTRDMLLNNHSQTIPSGTAYKRKPKHKNRGWDE